jgi:phosphoglycerate dehydrogenase-like enzyme
VYAEPCAEHVLAFMLAQARRLPQSLDNQRTERNWPQREHRAASRLLAGQTVVLLGFGAIGRRLVDLLGPFGMRIIALRRKPAGGETVRVIAGDRLPAALAEADHVIDLLPDNSATHGFVDERRFAAIKTGAIFYNIGRGTTVRQDALLVALCSGRLAAAYLDVTDPEPLPAEHPLWTAPNCYITPHTAGGHDVEPERLVRHFLANLDRFTRGRPLNDRIL